MDLKLPPLGEGADSGNVVSILVKEGDTIAKGQGMIEVETGKAVAPVPASAAGKVTKIAVSIGDKISVGQTILSIEGGVAAPTAKPAPAAAKPQPAERRPAAPAPLPELRDAAKYLGCRLQVIYVTLFPWPENRTRNRNRHIAQDARSAFRWNCSAIAGRCSWSAT